MLIFSLERILQFYIKAIDQQNRLAAANQKPQKPKCQTRQFFSPKIKAGEKIRFAHLSDIHNCLLDADYLSHQFKKNRPDFIIITGDGGHNQKLISSFTDSYHNFLDLCQQLVKLEIPIIYIEGNQDYFSFDYLNHLSQLKVALEKIGIIFLQDGANIEISVINIIGLSDSSYSENIWSQLYRAEYRNTLNPEKFNLGLLHRLEIPYQKNCADPRFHLDLVCGGHAHGGQFRIPFLGLAAIAPGGGFLPQVSRGLMKMNYTFFHISPGSAKCFGPRIFNPALVTFFELQHGCIQKNRLDWNIGLNILAKTILKDPYRH